MKRSLKPTDLRDMTLGQLQVIVNDLHSQIESEFTHTHTQRQWPLLWVTVKGKGTNREKTKHKLTPTISSGCESTFTNVSQFKELYQFTVFPWTITVSTAHITDPGTLWWIMCSSSDIKLLQNSPRLQAWWAASYQHQGFPEVLTVTLTEMAAVALCKKHTVALLKVVRSDVVIPVRIGIIGLGSGLVDY